MIDQLQVLKNVIYTIRGIYNLWIFIIGLFILQGCSSDDDKVILSGEKQIISFQFEAFQNTDLEMDIVAILDQNNKTITATVPFNTNITALKATIKLSAKASVSPIHKLEQDYSNPVIYTVTAQDGTRLDYKVIVKVTEPATDREVLIAFLKANSGHKINWDLNDETMDSWYGVIHENGKVVKLNLANKNISIIPSYFRYLQGLTFLNLNSNTLKSIPIAIGKLTQLTVLNLSENDLKELPKEISGLVNLRSLNLYSNELTGIPTEIGNLTNLKILSLKLNRLNNIPIEIGNLTRLTDLNLSSTSLTSVPAEIGNLTRLDYLALTDNNLTSIPKAVCNLETNYGTTVLKDAGVNCL